VDVFMEHNTIWISLHSDLANIHTWQRCTRARRFSPSGYLVRKTSSIIDTERCHLRNRIQVHCASTQSYLESWRKFSRLVIWFQIISGNSTQIMVSKFQAMSLHRTPNIDVSLVYFQALYILSVRWWQHHRRVGFPCSRFEASRTGAFLHEKAKEAAEILLLLS
jgi:hypothetical protein